MRAMLAVAFVLLSLAAASVAPTPAPAAPTPALAAPVAPLTVALGAGIVAAGLLLCAVIVYAFGAGGSEPAPTARAAACDAALRRVAVWLAACAGAAVLVSVTAMAISAATPN